jgi:2-iminobutanoate/2-iminopropanoate deaminase
MTQSPPDFVSRRAIEIDGFSHHNPIPAAARLGPLLVSSMVVGYQRGTTLVPDTPEAQVENIFAYVADILAEAAATWDDVVRMTFYVPDLQVRPAINGPWLEHFPDPSTRPARVTHAVPTDLGIRAEFVAYLHNSRAHR